ncbi:MAG TPA: transporter [Burkholderiales bacterium]|nr:transporter [Burkholderiales bacterium]
MHPIQRGLAAAAGTLLLAGNAAAQTGAQTASQAVAAQQGEAPRTSVSAGAEYTTGKYGSPDKTETLYIPFILRHETGPWVLKATVPWLRITGPGNVIGAGADRVVVPGVDNARRTESGLGDIVLSAFYNVLDERKGGLGLDLGAKVKLPTADDQKGLGTGELDYAAQMDFFKPFDATTLFGSIGYRVYGDPAGVTLKDVFYTSIGASYRMSSQQSVGVAYDYRPAIVNGGGKVSEATLFWSNRLSPEWKLQVYGLVGFADASPDAGIGALLERRF